MMILFVMGVMHLGWMAAIGALILLEKLVPAGRFIPQVIGAVFVVLGIIATLFPTLLLELSSEIRL
jgi:predicted metal-binding membrane protein